MKYFQAKIIFNFPYDPIREKIFIFPEIMATYLVLFKYRDICIELTTKNEKVFLVRKMIENIYNLPIGSTCGIFPLKCEVTITTSGLKYNLKNSKLSFDYNISSSNQILNQITIITSDDVLFYYKE